jgi:hypothetical protein
VIDDLSMDLAVEAETGWTTVGGFAASDVQHLRIQSPYRDSTSWAAYLGRHKDGSPFLYDTGTSEKHVLDDAAKLAAAQELLARLRAEDADGPAFCTPAARAAARLKVGDMASFTELKGHLRTRKTRVLSDWSPAVTAAAAQLGAQAQEDDDLLELVAEWFRARFGPTLLYPDNVVLCGDRKVKLSMVNPDRAIVAAIMSATGKTHQGAVNIFTALMRIVAGDLRDTLEVASRTAGTDDWCTTIANLLYTPIPYNLHGIERPERRYPIGSLALHHAGLIGEERRKVGHWRRVPLLPLWGRTTDRGPWIALWPRPSQRCCRGPSRRSTA